MDYSASALREPPPRRPFAGSGVHHHRGF